MPRTYTRTYCQIDECGRRCVGRGMCDMHYRRWRRWGDPRVTHPNPRVGPSNGRWAGGSYITAHIAVARERGKASEQDCVECGETAAHWAYTHDDPNELRSRQGWPYSLDVARYVPMCRTCHKRYDLARPA